jgi:hypothetical protein
MKSKGRFHGRAELFVGFVLCGRSAYARAWPQLQPSCAQRGRLDKRRLEATATVPPAAGTVEVMHRVNVAAPEARGMIGCSSLTLMLLFCFRYAARIMLLKFLRRCDPV